jgi:hypothetical protein
MCCLNWASLRGWPSQYDPRGWAWSPEMKVVFGKHFKNLLIGETQMQTSWIGKFMLINTRENRSPFYMSSCWEAERRKKRKAVHENFRIDAQHFRLIVDILEWGRKFKVLGKKSVISWKPIQEFTNLYWETLISDLNAKQAIILLCCTPQEKLNHFKISQMW